MSALQSLASYRKLLVLCYIVSIFSGLADVIPAGARSQSAYPPVTVPFGVNPNDPSMFNALPGFDNVTPAGVPAPEGPTPPIGSGDNAGALIPGDSVAASPPSNPQVRNSPSNFSEAPELVRGTTNLLINEGTVTDPSTGQVVNRGWKVVLTLRGDQLTSNQSNKISSLLKQRLVPGNIKTDVNTIIAIQNMLYPYPETNNANPKKIVSDSLDDEQYWELFNDYRTTPYYRLPYMDPRLSSRSQLTTVRLFCRWLVLLGAVIACVYMAFAAFSLVQGDREAGGRILGTAGGLILLLMSFSIWKVVLYNTRYFGFNMAQNQHNSPGDFQRKSRSAKPAMVPLLPADTPVVPSAPTQPIRSNLPVNPLGAPAYQQAK